LEGSWHEFKPFDPRKIIFRFRPLLCLKQAIGILVNNFGEGTRQNLKQAQEESKNYLDTCPAVI
jgi:hypothetical protein